jgi:hypothetical protein
MTRNQLVNQIIIVTDAAGGEPPDVWYLSIEDYAAICREEDYPQEELTLLGVKIRMAATAIGGVWERHVKRVP